MHEVEQMFFEMAKTSPLRTAWILACLKVAQGGFEGQSGGVMVLW